MTNYDRVASDALALSEKDRAELACRLLDSLERKAPDDDQEREKIWIAEAKRRLSDWRAGKTRTIPVSESLERARRAANGQF